MVMMSNDEASEADDLVFASGEADAACVANGLGGASDARVPGESSDGRWDPIPILVKETFDLQGSLTAVLDCPKCKQEGRSISCLGSKQMNEHISSQHPGLQTKWVCSQCGRTFPTVHSWRCHYPKCKGPTEATQAAHKCDSCPMSFGSRIGLSQHERHAHPRTRNAKRAAAAEKPQEKGGRRPTVWTAGEMELLSQLEAKYVGERNINIRLMEFFPGKTNRQIGDARRRIKQPAAPDPQTGVDLSEDRQAVADHPERHPPEETGDVEAAAANLPQGEEAVDAETIEDPDWRSPLVSEINRQGDVPDKWAALDRKLVELTNNQKDQDAINSFCELLAGALTSETKPAREGVNRPESVKRGERRRNKKRPPNRAERRRYAFAKCRELMNSCPKKLADAVAANDLSLLQMRQAPGHDETRELYVHLWGTPGPEQDVVRQAGMDDNTIDIFTPVTPAEVEQKIKRIANSSAAGVDGVRKAHLRSRGVSVILAKLFNLLLAKEVYPEAWKRNRTTLIPKAGKDPADIRNWRPITISSMLGRIFSSLLDRRVRSVIRQNERQKGFTHENGCFANTRLLSAGINEAKISGGVITILDVSKAFDTVPHQAIRPSLERKGVSRTAAAYVAGTYSGCQTTIRTMGGEVPIELKRGVKQGDPLSPLLFNLAIEPIIEQVQNTSSGITVEGENLSAMAFADDMVLLARDRETAVGQIQLVHAELRKRGMKLSLEKCFAFQYVPNQRTWYVKDPEMVVGGTPIAYGEPDKAFRYLGASVTPWRGLIEGLELETIRDVINRVKALPIKPMQKVTLLRTYLLPRYTYGFVMRPPSKETLKNIDSAIRSGVKSILHLHESTNNAFLYTPRKEGGLGLSETLPMVYLAALRNAARAARSDDVLVRRTIESEASRKQLGEYAAAVRLTWPTTVESLENRKRQIKGSYKREWAQMLAQGQGVEDFAQEPLSNAWLSRSDLLKSSRVIDAIKLRTNTFPTRTVMKRAYRETSPICRACGEADETLGHILGQCRTTKNKRIKRHNEIVDLLKERLSRSNRVIVEPTIELAGERYRPDLVITNEERVLVLDVTVRYENKNFLAEAATEKINKYNQIAQKLRRDTKVREARVVPIVVGSRGALPKATTTELRRLKIGRKDWLTIAMIALRSSIELINAFMDN